MSLEPVPARFACTVTTTFERKRSSKRGTKNGPPKATRTLQNKFLGAFRQVYKTPERVGVLRGEVR